MYLQSPESSTAVISNEPPPLHIYYLCSVWLSRVALNYLSAWLASETKGGLHNICLQQLSSPSDSLHPVQLFTARVCYSIAGGEISYVIWIVNLAALSIESACL